MGAARLGLSGEVRLTKPGEKFAEVKQMAELRRWGGEVRIGVLRRAHAFRKNNGELR